MVRPMLLLVVLLLLSLCYVEMRSVVCAERSLELQKIALRTNASLAKYQRANDAVRPVTVDIISLNGRRLPYNPKGLPVVVANSH